MPSVPRYNRQVEETTIPTLKVNREVDPALFGGGPAFGKMIKAAGDVFGAAGDIAQDERKKADQLAVLEADQRAAKLEIDLQYAPKTGAMTRTGKDAFALPDEVKGSWDKGMEEIKKNLHNDDQRTAFQRSSQARWLNIYGNVQRHVSTEQEKFDTQTTEAYIATERDAAATNYMQPQRIIESIGRQQAAIQDHSIRKGLPDEVTKQMAYEASSKTHTAVINRMLANNQDVAAKAWFDSNKDAISSNDELSLEKNLNEGSIRGESQRQTDQIMAKHGTWKERLEAAKTIEQPEIRDEVDRRLKTNMQSEKTLEAYSEEQNSLDATNIIEKSKDFDDVPPNMVSKMSTSTRNSLRNYADSLREGRKPATEWDTFYDLKTMASNDDTRSLFLRENLMDYRDKLGDTEFKEMVNLQTSMRKGDDQDIDGYRTKATIVNDTLNAAGIDPTPKPGAKNAEQVALFRRKVDEEIGTMQAQTGKKVTNDDVQGIVDNLIIKGKVPGTGIMGVFQKKKRGFELGEGQALNVEFEDIPKIERQKIQDALRRNNIAATEDKVAELYGRKLQRMANNAR